MSVAMGILATKPTVSSSLIQTINVKLDTANPTIPGWNIWKDSFEGGVGVNTTPFLNTLGATTGFLMETISGYFESVTYSATKNDPDFPDAVINRLVYTLPTISKQLKITGLDNSKVYDIVVCSFANDADNSDNTDIIVNGVTQFVAVNTNTIVYKTSFLKVSPISGAINLTIQGSPLSGKYGCANAFKLFEYLS